MILSASRRTDIPAYYADWFRNRLREGFCTVRNPFRPSQVRRVSLVRTDVDAFVFWTRDARPFARALDDLDRERFPYMFLVTLTGYPAPLEPGEPHIGELVGAFLELSHRVGPQRVAWRYDPVLLSNFTPPAFHRENFVTLARALQGSTGRVIVSVVDLYAKTRRRLDTLRAQGFEYPTDPWTGEEMGDLLRFIAREARSRGMEAVSCCEPSARPFGIEAGACVDAGLLNRLFGLALSQKKDRGQRPDCRCAVSVDIGSTDTCPRGCAYCYATRSFRGARERYRSHDPETESLG